ncbi:probable 2-oxoglutarate-dependent dioxygenase AOP1 [Euphorbia lathyris]|uniref:probable 2-oxoglutarate-dependent dioxygenase AOP1 n=1 Tax=Euphorbia lathyris TaxID=212925 RepID=UPI003313FC60
MNAAMEDIFSLQIETKKLNVSKLPFHVYIGSSSKSLYERIAVSYPDNFDNLQSFTNPMWPQGNINFSEIVHWFSVPLSESFGVEKYLDEHLNSTYCYWSHDTTAGKQKKRWKATFVSALSNSDLYSDS